MGGLEPCPPHPAPRTPGNPRGFSSERNIVKIQVIAKHHQPQTDARKTYLNANELRGKTFDCNEQKACGRDTLPYS